jgi:hypothetical protein
MPLVITHKKVCDCKATASGPRCYIKWQPDGPNHTYIVGWSSGPVCDKCQTPWKRIRNEATKDVTNDN